jgi:hypothetical protein
MEGFTDLTFRIKNEHVQRMLDAHCHFFGYRSEDIDGNPNPETPGQFVKRKLWRQMVNRTLSYEVSQLVTPGEIEGGEA